MIRDGPIAGAYRAKVTTQSYERRATIDGVKSVELPLFSDEGGDFCEIARFEADGTLAAFSGYRPAQVSYSYMEPGCIKAWHLHERQDDLWFVPPRHRLLVGLLDVRDGSSTYEARMRLTLGAGKPRLIFIPRGVAHGVANLSSEPASILYFADNAFDAAHPDEHRLPWDILGADFWTIRPG